MKTAESDIYDRVKCFVDEPSRDAATWLMLAINDYLEYAQEHGKTSAATWLRHKIWDIKQQHA